MTRLAPKKVYIGLISLGALGIVAAWFVYGIFRADLVENVNKIKQFESELTQKDLELVAIEQSIASAEAYQELETELDQFLPDNKAQSEAAEIVTGIFDVNGLRISGLQFNQTEGLPSESSQTQDSGISGVVSLPVTVNTDSEISYQTLIRLLRDLETSGRHISVTQLGVNPVEDSNLVTITVKLDIQLLSQAEEVPETDDIDAPTGAEGGSI